MDQLPGELCITDYDYALPDDRIAIHPLKNRDQSKLLVFQSGEIIDSNFSNLNQYLKEGSFMVFNESEVVHARLKFVNEKNNPIEIFCLEPADKNSEINEAMSHTCSVKWRCIVGGLKKWKDAFLNKEIILNNGVRIILQAEMVKNEGETCVVQLSWDNTSVTFSEILSDAGEVPLPPYIKRDRDPEDRERYQTVYAKFPGSVAAPTAGLHFTPEVFKSLESKQISVNYITLHVGAGTFKPVKATKIADHEMHSEQIVIDKAFILKLISQIQQNIIAVGTTSARTIESLYWLGLKIYLKKFESDKTLVVEQWDPYLLKAELSPIQSLNEIVKYLNINNLNTTIARTAILIVPGYSWKLVNVLVTNFHQPKSTLMLLVASFVGSVWKNIYEHALGENYRFLSYGDGSVLFK